MSTCIKRRPRSSIESFCTSNNLDNDGQWKTIVYTKGMWVTMQPSTRGAHKVSRRHIGLRSHHWKGRILELKCCAEGKMVKVQHVYKASQLKLSDAEQCRFPTNYIFPSDCVEWEPLQSLSGTFEAIHVDFGKLLYAGISASVLLDREVFFYGATYIVPTTRSGNGKLEPILAPSFTSPEWPIPDSASVDFCTRRLELDIQNAMKCTYGSHRATITLYMPLHLFVYLFRAGEVHRTPTMWIAKGERALSQFLPPTWNYKVVQHNGDTIRCCVMEEKVVVQYHIGKQQLSIVFPYRRWKRTRGEWDALDSDTVHADQVELHICMSSDEVHDVAVNDNWSLANLREYITIRFGWKGDFNFMMDGISVRKRKEKSLLCREIHFPRLITLKQSNPM